MAGLPVSVAASFQLALEHHQSGRLDQAQAAYQEILKAEPEHADVLHYLGVIAYQRGKYQESVELIQRAIDHKPDQHTFYLHIGPAYRALRQYDAALRVYGKAIELAPEDADAHNNLGNLYRQMGDFPKAVASFQRASRLRADDPVIAYNLGGALTDAGRLDEAVACFQQAVRRRPDYADAWNDLGKVYRLQGRLGEAAASYQRAIDLNPRHSLAHNNLAGIFKVHGATAKALEHYRKALEIHPLYADAYSNMLFALQYTDLMATQELFAEHIEFGRRFEVPLLPGRAAHPPGREPGKRLNIGYVSADFNHHAVAYFIEPVLSHHDKTQVAVTCYYNGTRHDAFTERIVAAADQWVACKALSDEQLAQRIRADGIDILVDLSGHTAGNRLLVFARKPAPLQITWLGYFGTTGLCAMDYRFTDPYMDPPGFSDSIHTEELLRLPHFSPFQSADNSPAVTPLPALRTGTFTLASLNNLAKLNGRVVRLWAEILRALPHATLMLCNIGDGETKRVVLEMFAREGVGEDRLQIQPWLPILDYLALHQHIDLALDTFPYNGGTITNHSLWMGVPVVTLAGDRPVGRIGASLMMHAGLPQFIVQAEADYLNCVLHMANDLPELNRVRLGLRARLASNLQTTTIGLTRAVEQSYRSIWQKWCAQGTAVDLQTGLDHHKAGRLAQAESIYQNVLQHQPDQPDALHLLGVLRHQQGRLDVAVALISRAIALAPTAVMHCKLAAVHQQRGNLELAVSSYQAALRLDPKNANGHLQLAELLKQMGRWEAAGGHARQALALQPDSAQALGVLGNVLRAQGDPSAAIACYDQALELQPDCTPAHLNRGNALVALGRYEEALASYHSALKYASNSAQAYNGIGVVMHALGDYARATQYFTKALALNPDFAEAHNNLGNAWTELGQLNLAQKHCQKAIEIAPDFAGAYLNLGDVLQAAGRLDEAVPNYQRAISLKPDFVEAYSNLGSAQQLQGRLAEAQTSYRVALDIAPKSARIHSNLLFALSADADCTPAQYLAEARRFDAMVSTDARPFSAWPAAAHEHGQPLRVGFVSGDFKNHPVGFFLENLLTHIDPERVVLFAYPSNSKEDELTQRIKPHFAAWKQLTGMSDATAASMIHGDGMHVLIDLAGHTAQNRLAVFAWRPAPLQIGWLGYWASTGMSSIDYVLADPLTVMPVQEGDFSEKIWRLPHTRMCFSPPDAAPEVTALPALHNGFVTFSSFQNLFKLNDSVLSLWAKVMHALPTARLRLQNKQMNSPSERFDLQRRLQEHGIDLDRVSIYGPSGRVAYFAAHSEVDIILDTFPYSGGTTTCEALWMGVPTLTLVGSTMLSRQGMSLLGCAGLDDWIADDGDAYVRLALEHATDVTGLAQLRSGLRERVRESPLFDGQLFARHFENALCEMWCVSHGD